MDTDAVLKDTEPGIHANPHQVWQGDCLEFFLDLKNTRSSSRVTINSTHQFCLMPFGYKGNKSITFSEWIKTKKKNAAVIDRAGRRGKAAFKMLANGGYQIECFIKSSALSYPTLTPGMILGCNASINNGKHKEQQWSAPKSAATYDKPNTWGDLLLLGTDGKLSVSLFKKENGDKIKAILPGEPIKLKITDLDMNIRPDMRDSIPAQALVKGSNQSLFIVLKETGIDTGIFEGSFNTQAYYKPTQPNTIGLRGGNTLELIYNDLRGAYGEKNKKAVKAIKVGWPVTKLGGSI